MDATTTTQWAADHAAEIRADPERLLIAGEGIGADLAAAVAAWARANRWPPLTLLSRIATSEPRLDHLACALRLALGADLRPGHGAPGHRGLNAAHQKGDNR